MRLRGLILVALVVAAALVSADRASAQQPGGGGAFGDDQQAGGQLLGDGTAEAFASDGRDLGPADHPRRGGGDVVCRLYDDATGDPIDLTALSPALDGQEVMILRICEDRTTGEYVRIEIITVVPPVVTAIQPRELAAMARSRLPLPLPHARTNPDGPQTVNVETWLWVDNWRAESRSATAAGVTATVTATPVKHTWTFGSPAETKTCFDAGVPYDTSRPSSEQATSCSYTFRHSSQGQQAQQSGGVFVPADVYAVKVTLTWHVTWSSNIGPAGDLGFVSRTLTIPMPVHERHALN